MKWTVWLGIAALSLCVASNASAGFFGNFINSDELSLESHRTYFVKVSGGLALQEIKGDLLLGGSLDSDLDFDDTLGFKDDKSFWARVDFQPFMRHHLRFTYTPLSFSGSEDTPAGGLSVGGQGFSLGEVNSQFDLDTYDFAYQWDALYLGERVTLSPILNVSLLDGSAEVKNKDIATGNTIVSESESFFIPIPSIGLRAEAYPASRIGTFFEFKGMTIGKKATTWDVEGGFDLFLIRNVSINARYRYAVYEADVSGIKLDSKMFGPYVGLGLRF